MIGKQERNVWEALSRADLLSHDFCYIICLTAPHTLPSFTVATSSFLAQSHLA